jgi:ParB family transcriptional regulator, chromosome partitioning protein
MNTENIPLNKLQPHPANSNVMPEHLVTKLAKHIQRTGHYPPLIVRPLSKTDNDITHDTGDYQILDGHHRAIALKQAGINSADCVVWQADDQEALVLLATLNRLQGQDDPRKRANLLGSLADQHDLASLSNLLPERIDQLKKYLEIRDHPPPPRPPKPIAQMPVAVHFFLLPHQKKQLDAALRQFDGSREEALMNLLDQHTRSTPHDASSN